MSQIPLYTNPAFQPPPTRLSASAITSFVLSLIFCIPVLSSFTAILFAIVGIRATRLGAQRGRGFAIAGLILGLLGLIFWTLIIFTFAIFMYLSQGPRLTLRTFTQSVAAGNIPVAAANADPSLTPVDLEAIHATVIPWGTYNSLTCTGIHMSATTASPQICSVSGTAHFATGSHPFTATLTKDPAATRWKVTAIHFY